MGMESNSTLFRIYVPSSKSIIITRRADFRQSSSELLPSVSVLLDGLSRQHEVETSLSEEGDAEQQLFQSLSSLHQDNKFISYSANRKRRAEGLPRSFAEACEDPLWREAIDREYNALVNRGTWEYVEKEEGMRAIPFTWVFKLKHLDQDGSKVLHKARCCLRGERQKAFVDFDPESTYAPVASHESLRMLMHYAASENLLPEGADISNAYLYGNVDVPILMEQPTNSSQVPARPGCLSPIVKSIYGVKQAGKLWGSFLSNKLTQWKFLSSKIELRLYFLRHGSSFIIVAVVVYDIAFVSNSRPLLEI